MYLIKPRYIKREPEVRTDEFLDKVTTGEDIGHLVENVVIIVIEVMAEVEVILEEVIFEVGPVVILGEMMVGTEVERIEGLGDSLDQEKEE